MPVAKLRNEEWLQDVCFLVEITEIESVKYGEFQGQNNVITDACNFIKAFQIKLLLLENQFKNHNAQHFHC